MKIQEDKYFLKDQETAQKMVIGPEGKEFLRKVKAQKKSMERMEKHRMK